MVEALSIARVTTFDSVGRGSPEISISSCWSSRRYYRRIYVNKDERFPMSLAMEHLYTLGILTLILVDLRLCGWLLYAVGETGGLVARRLRLEGLCPCHYAFRSSQGTCVGRRRR